jgi:two-component system cell cycle sensor histidine kinase/response regulator CckA
VPNGWVLVIRDVTQELVVQQQLERQERLAAIGQLAAGIAHDFNNIMSIIVMYAQIMLRSTGLTERERERMVTIDQQAMRASQMIRQILDFSRRSVLDRQPLDLLPLLKEQVKLLERTLQENIEIELVHEPGEFFVQADPTRMQQIVMNLAVNARDAMPEGGRLRFELVRVQAPALKEAPLLGMTAGTWVRATVTDTGTGIASAVMDHIFEPFYTTKDPGQGTGLGLAQVHGIVGQHDGYITVDSQLGVGTSFVIYLPALAVVAAGDGAAFTLTDLPRGQGQTILVVEDNEALRGTLVELLGTWGYAVEEATNGLEALARLAELSRPVDLIISDAVMPHMGGVGLFNALDRQHLRVPIILLTGHPLGDEQEALRQRGLRGVLAKPPSAEQLANMIAATLCG